MIDNKTLLEWRKTYEDSGECVVPIIDELIEARKQIDKLEGRLDESMHQTNEYSLMMRELESDKTLHIQMILDKQFNQGLLEAKLGVAVEALEKIKYLENGVAVDGVTKEYRVVSQALEKIGGGGKNNG